MKKEDKALRSILDGKSPARKIMISTADMTETHNKLKKEKEERQKLANERLELFKEFRIPLACPVCGKSMSTKLDSKFWALRSRCFECVVKEETKMRAIGVYEDYERRIMLENKLSWLRDQIQSVQEWKEASLPTFHNQVAADGTTLDEEKWTGNKKVLTKMADDAILEYIKEKEISIKEINDIKIRMNKHGADIFNGIFKD